LFNFIGILSQGLRIAPPEAPPTGYLFGKGVYFADMFSKSFAYSAGRIGRSQDSSLLLLCEVALGKQKKLWQAGGDVQKPAHPYHSVHGVGRVGPDYGHSLTLPDGVEIPTGRMTEYRDGDPATKTKENPAGHTYLQHNEFVVYDTAQIRMRHLVQVVKKTKEELREGRLHDK